MPDASSSYKFKLIVDSEEAQAKLLNFQEVIETVLKPPTAVAPGSKPNEGGVSEQASENAVAVIQSLDKVAGALLKVSTVAKPVADSWNTIDTAMKNVAERSSAVILSMAEMVDASIASLQSLSPEVKKAFNDNMAAQATEGARKVATGSIIPDMVDKIKEELASLKKQEDELAGASASPAGAIGWKSVTPETTTASTAAAQEIGWKDISEPQLATLEALKAKQAELAAAVSNTTDVETKQILLHEMAAVTQAKQAEVERLGIEVQAQRVAGLLKVSTATAAHTSAVQIDEQAVQQAQSAYENSVVISRNLQLASNAATDAEIKRTLASAAAVASEDVAAKSLELNAASLKLTRDREAELMSADKMHIDLMKQKLSQTTLSGRLQVEYAKQLGISTEASRSFTAEAVALAKAGTVIPEAIYRAKKALEDYGRVSVLDPNKHRAETAPAGMNPEDALKYERDMAERLRAQGQPAKGITVQQAVEENLDPEMVVRYNKAIDDLWERITRLRTINQARGLGAEDPLAQILETKKYDEVSLSLDDITKAYNKLVATAKSGTGAFTISWDPVITQIGLVREQYHKLEAAYSGKYGLEEFKIQSAEGEGPTGEGVTIVEQADVDRLNDMLYALQGMLKARDELGARGLGEYLLKAEDTEHVAGNLSAMEDAARGFKAQQDVLTYSLKEFDDEAQKSIQVQVNLAEQEKRRLQADMQLTVTLRKAQDDLSVALGAVAKSKEGSFGGPPSNQASDAAIRAMHSVFAATNDTAVKQKALNSVTLAGVSITDSYVRQMKALTFQFYGLRRAGASMQQVGRQAMAIGKGYYEKFQQLSTMYSELNKAAAFAGAAMEMPNEMLDSFESKLMDTSVALKYVSATDLAKGLRDWAAGTGVVVDSQADLNRVMKETVYIQNLAMINNTTFGATVKTVGSILAEFNMQMTDVEHITEVLNWAAAKSFATLDDLGATFKEIGPIADDLGVTLEQVAAATAMLADYGLKGTKSGRALRQVFIQMLKPTEKSNEALNKALGLTEEMGTTWDDIVFPGGKFIGLAEYIDLLATVTAGYTDQQRESLLATIATANELPALVALIKAQSTAQSQGINVMRVYEKIASNNIDEEVLAYEKLYEAQMGVSMGADTAQTVMAKQLKIVSDASAARVAQLQRRWEQAMTYMGKAAQAALIGPMEWLNKALASAVSLIQSNPALIQTAAVATGATFVGGGLASIAGGIVQVLEMVLIAKGMIPILKSFVETARIAGSALNIAAAKVPVQAAAIEKSVGDISKVLPMLSTSLTIAGAALLAFYAVATLAQKRAEFKAAELRADKARLVGSDAAATNPDVIIEDVSAEIKKRFFKAFGSEGRKWFAAALGAGIGGIVPSYKSADSAMSELLNKTKGLSRAVHYYGLSWTASNEEGRKALRDLGYAEDAVLKTTEDIAAVLKYMEVYTGRSYFTFDKKAAELWGTSLQQAADQVYKEVPVLWDEDKQKQLDEDLAKAALEVPIDLVLPDMKTMGLDAVDEKLKDIARDVLTSIPDILSEGIGPDPEGKIAAARDALLAKYVEHYNALTAVAKEGEDNIASFEAEYYGERQDAYSAYSDSMQKILEDMSKDDLKATRQLGKDIAEADKTSAEKIISLREEHVKSLAKIREDSAEEEIKAAADNAKALADAQEDFYKSEASTVEELGRSLELQTRERRRTEIDNLKEHNDTLQKIREDAAQEEIEAGEQYSKDLLEIQADAGDTSLENYSQLEKDKASAIEDAHQEEIDAYNSYREDLAETEEESVQIEEDHRKALIDVEKKYQEDLDSLQKDHTDKMLDLLETRDAKAIHEEIQSYNDRKTELDKARKKDIAGADEEREQAKKDLAEKLADMDESYLKEKAKRAEQLVDKLADLDAGYKEEEIQLAEDTRKKIVELDERYAEEKAKRDEDLAVKLADEQVSFEQSKAQRLADYAVQDADAAEQREYDRQKRLESYNTKLADMTAQAELEKQQRASALAKELADEEIEQAAREAQEEIDHQKAIQNLRDRAAEVYAEKRQDAFDEIAALAAEFKEQEKIAQQAHDRELLGVRIKNQKLLAEAAKLAAEELKIKLEALEDVGGVETEAQRKSIQDAIDALEKRGAETTAAADALAKELREQELASLRGEEYIYGKASGDFNQPEGAASVPDLTPEQLKWLEYWYKHTGGEPIGAGWYGSGLDAVVNKRMLIGVGEDGPERVQVTPLRRVQEAAVEASSIWNIPGKASRLSEEIALSRMARLMGDINVNQSNWSFAGSMSSADREGFRMIAREEAFRAFAEVARGA